MRTSELINLLRASLEKFGDREVAGEILIIDQHGEPVMGRRGPIRFIAEAMQTRLCVTMRGATAQAIAPTQKVENDEGEPPKAG